MKPLLLGMNNPLSDDPEFDLYPYPEGSAGWRLWKMLPEGTTRRAYLDAFERLNLLRMREWDAGLARVVAKKLSPELEGRYVVVLGTEVRAALGLPKSEPLVEQRAHLFRWLPVPHPSGRNLWYNNPENRARVGAALYALMRDGVPCP